MSAYKKNPDNIDTKRFAILERDSQIRLTFTELESLTSFRTTRFLTLNSTRIASYESFRSQDSHIFRINLYQRTRDSLTGSLRLTFETTTVKVDLNIILLSDVQLC